MTQNPKIKSYIFFLKINFNILIFYIKSIIFYYFSNKNKNKSLSYLSPKELIFSFS
jgi:hypothetical protein